MLRENEDVVIYFGTGRGAIGSSPAMLYLMKDCVVVAIGQVEPIPCFREIALGL